jgi:hypothetical protein
MRTEIRLRKEITMTLQFQITRRSFAIADFRLGCRYIWGALITYILTADLEPATHDLPS